MSDNDFASFMLKDNVVMTTVDKFIGWARKSSVWPMTFGLACCAIEMMATGAAKFDLDPDGTIDLDDFFLFADHQVGEELIDVLVITIFYSCPHHLHQHHLLSIALQGLHHPIMLFFEVIVAHWEVILQVNF